jgi:hypothetical protein
MTVKEAISIITTNNNLMRVKQLNPKLGNKYAAWRERWKCGNHGITHKYTFHSIVEFCPGTARMYGVDTKEELITLAKTFIKQ